MKPIYKELKFETLDLFNEWLAKTTHTIVWFKDNGQDLTRINVAENGEIIDCDWQSGLWNGSFVDLSRLKPGAPIFMRNGHLKKWTEMDFIIENVF